MRLRKYLIDRLNGCCKRHKQRMLIRTISISLSLAATILAQSATNLFDKPPANIDDALRGRVATFYQYHVEGKFRLAEPLVSEESKDDFYAATKPKLEGFKISDISYSNDYRKAKVTLLARMEIYFLGMTGPEPHDVPIPSYWQIEKGEWRWYLNKDYLTKTPWGTANAKQSDNSVDPRTEFKPVELTDIMNQIAVDHSIVTMSAAVGSIGRFTITNSLPGSVTVNLPDLVPQGFEVKTDKTELKSGEKSLVSVRSIPGAHVNTNLRVIVQPINRVFDVAITLIN